MKYFNYEEFDSPDVQGSGQMMSKELLDILDKVRKSFGKPIVINSGYRTLAHNESVGGTENSSHLKGLAVDIACNNSIDRYTLTKLLMFHGVNRFGIAKTFIHVDIDPDKSPNVIWTY